MFIGTKFSAVSPLVWLASLFFCSTAKGSKQHRKENRLMEEKKKKRQEEKTKKEITQKKVILTFWDAYTNKEKQIFLKWHKNKHVDLWRIWWNITRKNKTLFSFSLLYYVLEYKDWMMLTSTNYFIVKNTSSVYKPFLILFIFYSLLWQATDQKPKGECHD